MGTDIDTDCLYSHVAPFFWPILWWHLQRITAWHAANASSNDLYTITVTWWGAARLHLAYQGDAPAMQHLRAFADCSAHWTLDVLGHEQALFARLKVVALSDVRDMLVTTLNMAGFGPAPIIQDSS